jgi:outer membrane protein TolC
MQNPVRLFGAWALLALLPVAAFAADPLTLAEAQNLAQIRAPQIRASLAREQAAREMAIAAGQLPDPVLKAGVNNVPISGESGWSLVQESMTMRSVALMQELTRGDKRQARALRATREAELAQISQRKISADVRRDTALIWLETAYLDSIRGLLETQDGELNLQRQAAEAAFRSGRGEQADIFAIRLARERNRDQLNQTQRDIAVAREQLARWIGDDASRPLGPLPDPTHLDWQPGALLAQANMHPTLAASQGEVALAEAEVSVSTANRKPDVSVELMYSQRGPSYPNMVSLNFSMPLTWDRSHRQDRELAAKLALLDQARAEQDDMRRTYFAMLRENLANWQADRERLTRYDMSLIPLSRGQLEAAEAAYKAGNGSLGRVLEARRMNIDSRIERQRIALETANAWAQLSFLDQPRNPAHSGQGVEP